LSAHKIARYTLGITFQNLENYDMQQPGPGGGRYFRCKDIDREGETETRDIRKVKKVH
jgi:hypothetical protein